MAFFPMPIRRRHRQTLPSLSQAIERYLVEVSATKKGAAAERSIARVWMPASWAVRATFLVNQGDACGASRVAYDGFRVRGLYAHVLRRAQAGEHLAPYLPFLAAQVLRRTARRERRAVRFLLRGDPLAFVAAQLDGDRSVYAASFSGLETCQEARRPFLDSLEVVIHRDDASPVREFPPFPDLQAARHQWPHLRPECPGVRVRQHAPLAAYHPARP